MLDVWSLALSVPHLLPCNGLRSADIITSIITSCSHRQHGRTTTRPTTTTCPAAAAALTPSPPPPPHPPTLSAPSPPSPTAGVANFKRRCSATRSCCASSGQPVPTRLPTYGPACIPAYSPACLLTHLTIRMLSIRHTPHLSTTFMSPSPHTLCMLVRVRPPTCSHVCVRPRVRMCAPAHVFSCVRACARPWSGALPCARRATMCLNAILNACMLSQARTFAEGVCHMPACDSVDAVPCHVLCPVHRGLSCA